jgi:hypothetical protein
MKQQHTHQHHQVKPIKSIKFLPWDFSPYQTLLKMPQSSEVQSSPISTPSRNASALSFATADTMESWSADDSIEDSVDEVAVDPDLEMRVEMKDLLYSKDVEERWTTTFLDNHVLPKMNSGSLPRQAAAAGWLRHLLPHTLLCAMGFLLTVEVSAQILVKTGVGPSFINVYIKNLLAGDPFYVAVTVAMILVSTGRAIAIDVFTLVMLWHGKQRRELPKGKRLVHAVVVTQYREVSIQNLVQMFLDQLLTLSDFLNHQAYGSSGCYCPIPL